MYIYIYMKFFLLKRCCPVSGFILLHRCLFQGVQRTYDQNTEQVGTDEVDASAMIYQNIVYPKFGFSLLYTKFVLPCYELTDFIQYEGHVKSSAY